MRTRVSLSLLALLLCAGTVPAAAEVIRELRRSAYGDMYAISTDPHDGSCWVGSGASVLHLSAAGELLLQVDGFFYPGAVQADPRDGSCWVADSRRGDIVHLGTDGTEVLRAHVGCEPHAISLDVRGGSLWVADIGSDSVLRVNPAGTVEKRFFGFGDVGAVSACQADGSCWVNARGDARIVHLAGDGTVIWQATGYYGWVALSVDQSDGSCWVAQSPGIHPNDGAVIKLAADGTELARVSGLPHPTSVSADATTGIAWVCLESDSLGGILRLDRDGAPISSYYGVQPWGSLSANTSDGSCWVADRNRNQLLRLLPDGLTSATYDRGIKWPAGVAVSPKDGSVWLCSWGNGEVLHLDQDGQELWRAAGLVRPRAVAVSSAASWVADIGSGDVVHLSPEGTEVWRRQVCPVPGIGPGDVAVDQRDGSSWATDGQDLQLVRLSEAGDELWRSPVLSDDPYARFYALALDPTDGSCRHGLASATYAEGVAFVASVDAVGTEAWRTWGFLYVMDIAVDPRDRSCWVLDGIGQIAHLSADGIELGRIDLSDQLAAEAVAVDPGDGSLWAAGAALRHYAADGTELAASSGRGSYLLNSISLDPSDHSVWASDGATGQLVHATAVPGADFAAEPLQGSLPLPVSFSDRSDCGATAWTWDFGDGGVSAEQNPLHRYPAAGTYTVQLTVLGPEGSSSAIKPDYVHVSFRDIPSDFWAEWSIRVCQEAGIVAGYADGTYHPELPVTRDQMAAFVARAIAGGAHSVPTGPSVATFPDVPLDHWAYRAIEYAHANHIVMGYPDGKYHPDLAVDRAQMAVFIARADATPFGDEGLAWFSPPATPSFADVPPDFWAHRYIIYDACRGIVAGYSDGYHPAEICTRDQMAAFVQRGLCRSW